MSLRRRIALATALAVAAVATAVAATGYLSTRAHLRNEVDHMLLQRAAQYTAAQPQGGHGGGAQPNAGAGAGTGSGSGTASGTGSAAGSAAGSGASVGSGTGSGASVSSGTGSGASVSSGAGAGAGAEASAPPPGGGPPGLGGPPGGPPGVGRGFGPGGGGFPPGGGPGKPSSGPLGGAPGYFQFVYPDGTVVAANGGTPKLPVTARTRALAAAGKGRYFTDETVDGTQLRVLTAAAGSGSDRFAVQVGLSLADDDRVLHSLLVSYLLIVAGGIVLAIVLGGLIGRNALRPIVRFTQRTEAVTGDLDVSQRLEVSDAIELGRLAASFNRTLDALERSVQAQRHLVADASHELRTPLAALRSDIQIFLEAERLPLEERLGLQEAIIAELDELTQLVADVVELARGTSGDERPEVVDLDQIVRESVERVRRRAPDLTLQVELEPTEIVNSAERVARAATNVLDNARKWSPPDGVIEVTLADGVLTVRDHGPGFSERDLPHVFDRFYRADAARSMPGSGLGLAIVRQAAEAHGGFAQAANAEGGGALLRVRFGSAPSPASARPPGTPPAAQPVSA